MNLIVKNILFVIAFLVLTPIYVGLYFYFAFEIKMAQTSSRVLWVCLFTAYWMFQTYKIMFFIREEMKFGILLALPYIIAAPFFFAKYNAFSVIMIPGLGFITIIYSYLILLGLEAKIIFEYKKYKEEIRIMMES